MLRGVCLGIPCRVAVWRAAAERVLIPGAARDVSWRRESAAEGAARVFIKTSRSFQTSFTLTWASYLLALHPHIQEQIHSEVNQTLGLGAVPTADDVPHLPLIRGLVKETLRFVF